MFPPMMADSLISRTDHESKVPYLFRYSTVLSCENPGMHNAMPAKMVNESIIVRLIKNC